MSLIPDDAEDMWHIYNLIREGDRVRGSTLRLIFMPIKLMFFE